MNEIVESPSAQTKTAHYLALMDFLVSVSDNASLHQVNESIGEHFWVDAYVFMTPEAGQHLIRYVTDP